MRGSPIRFIYGLGSGRHCSLCGFEGYRFSDFGRLQKRRDIRCPGCGSLERHRLVHRLLEHELSPGQRTLHVAPERCVVPWLERISADYLSIDLMRKAMASMDLTRLDLPDGDRTLVWCSHVLEHIEQDRKAMSEMYRVLAPGGRAVIQVPATDGATFEDFSITEPEAREEAFLQWDHVRLYGQDIAERLREAGFEVRVLGLADLPPETVARERLDCSLTNDVFVCMRHA